MTFDGQKLYDLLPALYRLRDAKLAQSQNVSQGPLQALINVIAEQFAALEDDLNTPLAIAELHALLDRLNKTNDPATQAELKGALLAAGRLLGFFQVDPEDWFDWTPPQVEAIDEAAILAQIEARNAARKAKDFATADRIRDELKQNGVTIEDGAQGTTWRRS